MQVIKRLVDLEAEAMRDRALILFLYNTGARAQEVADLRAEHLDLGEHPIVRLHGKGGNRQVRLRSAGDRCHC